MNKYIKRALTCAQILFLALTLCLQGFATSQNIGVRHIPCDALSEAANLYYMDYDYQTLSALPSELLLTTLQQLMAGTHRYHASYSDCRDMASRTDSMGSDGKISLLYTATPVTRADFGGNTGSWNREHVWPKSLGGFGESGAGSDLHHIRPSDATVNSKRGNLKFGNVTNGTDAVGSSLTNGSVGGRYNGTYFEPTDNVKGDVARICLYVYARYGTELPKCSQITNVFESKEVLLQWCLADPVDSWEMSRNDVIEEIQGNRNVFIDYPEYAWLIFEEEIPDNLSTPSLGARQNTTPLSPKQPPMSGGNGIIVIATVACAVLFSLGGIYLGTRMVQKRKNR